MRRIVASRLPFEEADKLAMELLASDHYKDVYVMKGENDLYEVWVEDKEE